jgi:hypothetical protein
MCGLLLLLSTIVSVADTRPLTVGAKRISIWQCEPGGMLPPMLQVVLTESIAKLPADSSRLSIIKADLLRNGLVRVTSLALLTLASLRPANDMVLGVNAQDL